MSPVPIDRGWAFVVVFGFFLSSFIMVGIAKSFGILLAEFMKFFPGTPVAEAALVMGVSGIVYTLCAPFAIAFGELLTQRKVVIIGSIVGFIMISLSSLLVNMEFIIFFYGVGTGIANSCFFGNGLVMVGQYFKKWRTLANGIALSGASIGTFVIPLLLQALLDSFGLQGAMLIIGAIYLNGCICGALYRPTAFYTKFVKKETVASVEEKVPLKEQERESELKNETPVDTQMEKESTGDDKEIPSDPEEDQSTELLNAENEKFVETRAEISSNKPSSSNPNSKNNITISCCGKKFVFPKLFHFYVLRMPVVIFFTVFSFVVFFGYFNFVLFLPADVLSRGVQKYEKALLVSFVGGGDLLGRILVGILGDFNLIERYKILALTTILCGVNILMIEFASVYWWMAIHATLYGFFGGAYVAINAIVVIDMVGLELMPKVLGIVMLIQGLGAAVGQPIEGEIKDQSKSFTPLNIINSLCMIIGGFLLFFYPLVKRYQERQSNTHKEVEVVVADDEE